MATEKRVNISEAARRCGLSAKTIRYYEEIGLIEPAERSQNGYRSFNEQAVEELQFIGRARDAGFDLTECRELLELQRDSKRHSRHARDLVLEKSARLSRQIERLRAMQVHLEALAHRCQGDEGPECAILEDLSGQGEVSS